MVAEHNPCNSQLLLAEFIFPEASLGRYPVPSLIARGEGIYSVEGLLRNRSFDRIAEKLAQPYGVGAIHRPCRSKSIADCHFTLSISISRPHVQSGYFNH